MIALSTTEYAPFYEPYIMSIIQNDKGILKNLLDTNSELFLALEDLPVEKQLYAYAEGKWTVKEVLQHIIDSERIFAYRALRIARKDKTPLAGFEQNDFVDNCNANDRDFSEMLEEFLLVRKSTILLFKSFSDEMLLENGTMSGNSVSVRAIGFIISGHLNHHLNVLKERYF